MNVGALGFGWLLCGIWLLHQARRWARLNSGRPDQMSSAWRAEHTPETVAQIARKGSR